MIGHALENDLKTLRMIHHRCVDTALLFPHRAGLPYRRSLRDLVREHLGRIIQAGGGTSGHSSVEDSIAALDLVRVFLLQGSGSKKTPTSNAGASASNDSSVAVKPAIDSKDPVAVGPRNEVDNPARRLFMTE